MLKVKVASNGLSPHLLVWLTGRMLLFDISEDSPVTFGVIDL
jgi:hypothetical protein